MHGKASSTNTRLRRHSGECFSILHPGIGVDIVDRKGGSAAPAGYRRGVQCGRTGVFHRPRCWYRRGFKKGRFQVIDGQQRLARLFLLLCAFCAERFAGQPQYPLLTGLLWTSYATQRRWSGDQSEVGAALLKCPAFFDQEPHRRDTTPIRKREGKNRRRRHSEIRSRWRTC